MARRDPRVLLPASGRRSGRRARPEYGDRPSHADRLAFAMDYEYPHTIENGAGERLTFLRRVPGPAGERLEVENVVKPGAGPPMHIHHYQVEALTIEEGRIGYERLGEPAKFAGPGEKVACKPGEAHRFWNPGPGDPRCT